MNRFWIFNQYWHHILNMTLIDLGISGYSIVKNFLTPTEIQSLSNDYSQNKTIDNTNYTASVASRSIEDILFPKIRIMLELIKKKSGITADFLIPIACYLNNKDSDFKWHQDHESFYVHQQHKNYLNFYIPFVKPDSKKSGLGIIPLDLLGMHCPYHINKIVNSGATRFFPNGNSTEVYNDDSGEQYILPINLDELAEYPELFVGDLLIMRGDIIHKTQDTLTNRNAVTVRCTDGDIMVNKNTLVNGCEKKLTIIKNNQRMYDNIISKFGDNNEIAAKKLYEDDSCLIAKK
ncbi:hypothetical protein UFOVP257_146 [uncultured Caudovirales phage]|uniref:Phytanoyl-CoA dioxygenase n=1 Tax=uncultured Caudovirales phage TaxID=2100421 RepID=A0A6J5LGS8_9CAUD|nr:hypothetical protein UFOVP257_146 [uncultured Caudovirales phage]